MNFREVGCQSVYWIGLTQSTVPWLTFLNMVMNLRFCKNM